MVGGIPCIQLTVDPCLCCGLTWGLSVFVGALDRFLPHCSLFASDCCWFACINEFQKHSQVNPLSMRKIPSMMLIVALVFLFWSFSPAVAVAVVVVCDVVALFDISSIFNALFPHDFLHEPNCLCGNTRKKWSSPNDPTATTSMVKKGIHPNNNEIAFYSLTFRCTSLSNPPNFFTTCTGLVKLVVFRMIVVVVLCLLLLLARHNGILDWGIRVLVCCVCVKKRSSWPSFLHLDGVCYARYEWDDDPVVDNNWKHGICRIQSNPLLMLHVL